MRTVWKPYRRRHTRWMLCAPAFPPRLHTAGKRGAHCIWCAGYCDKLLASLSSILLYWYHYSHKANAFSRKPMTTPSAVTSCISAWRKAVAKLGKGDAYFPGAYAEHEFNASTFTSRVIAGTGLICIPRLLARLVHCAGRSTGG